MIAMDLLTAAREQLPVVITALVSLPVAAGLGAVLAFRPRRRGTPARDSEIIHTQIILALVGALVMLVIGDSLARAFGIVGAAGLIRYRAQIKDPKDAGVMLCTLGLGLASGVGMYLLAVTATVFLLLVLWLVESHAPKVYVRYELRVETEDPFGMQARIEAVLKHYRLPYELRSCSDNELRYETRIPVDQPTDAVATELRKLESVGAAAFQWERKKAA
jgi:uncharacterized membrane protein YhiD involved in acid resistance